LLATRGDSVIVVDARSARVAVFSSGGELARTFVLEHPPLLRSPRLIGRYPNGEFLAAASETYAGDPPPGVFTMHQRLFRASPTGAAGPALTRAIERQFFMMKPARAEVVARYLMPFGLASSIQLVGDGYEVGDGRQFEMTQFDRAGKALRVVQSDAAGPRLGEPEKAAERERIIDLYRREPPGFAEFWSQVPWQDRLPVYRRFEVDAAGRLWVEPYQSAAAAATHWHVLDARRQYLGRISLPVGFRIHAFGSGGVLATQKDSDGAERWGFYRFSQ
jgi:hypothetical protein